MNIDNPHLGYVSPNYMIKVGRSKKLYQFVKACIEENKPIEESEAEKVKKEIKKYAEKAMNGIIPILAIVGMGVAMYLIFAGFEWLLYAWEQGFLLPPNTKVFN